LRVEGGAAGRGLAASELRDIKDIKDVRDIRDARVRVVEGRVMMGACGRLWARLR